MHSTIDRLQQADSSFDKGAAVLAGTVLACWLSGITSQAVYSSIMRLAVLCRPVEESTFCATSQDCTNCWRAVQGTMMIVGHDKASVRSAVCYARQITPKTVTCTKSASYLLQLTVLLAVVAGVKTAIFTNW